MKSAIFTSVAFFAASALAQIQIDTPTNVVVCKPIRLTFVGGTPPYDLSIIAAGTVEPALVDFPNLQTSPYTWNANLPIGTSLFLNLLDSTGLKGQSAPFTILTGSDTSCIGQPASSAAAPSGTSATLSASSSVADSPVSSVLSSVLSSASAAVSSAVSSVESAASSVRPTSSGTGTTSARPSAASSAAPSNAASANTAYGAAGLIGAAVLAVLV